VGLLSPNPMELNCYAPWVTEFKQDFPTGNKDSYGQTLSTMVYITWSFLHLPLNSGHS
jgi:hypothetical protein